MRRTTNPRRVQESRSACRALVFHTLEHVRQQQQHPEDQSVSVKGGTAVYIYIYLGPGPVSVFRSGDAGANEPPANILAPNRVIV